MQAAISILWLPGLCSRCTALAISSSADGQMNRVSINVTVDVTSDSCLMHVSFLVAGSLVARTIILWGKSFENASRSLPLPFHPLFPFAKAFHLLMNPDMTLNHTSPISHKVCIITSGLYFVSKQSDGYLIAAIGSSPNHTS